MNRQRPAALNTLKELASALGSDANCATAIQIQLALKAPKVSPIFSGSLNADDMHAASLDLTGALVVGGDASASRLATNTIIGNGASQITIDNDVVVGKETGYKNLTVIGSSIGNAATLSGGIGVSGTATFTGPTRASNFTVSGLLKVPS